MRKLTFGQTLVLFDAMVKLHVLTNPFGSGKEKKPDETPFVEGAQALHQSGFFNARAGSVSELPPEIQAYLNEHEGG
jgi:hypothetical protein